MIEFVTLFLGIVVGVQTVEVEATEEVRAIVFSLDSREVARLQAPPWRASIDFGSTPEPHLLEAVALDAGGAELAEARQWLNLPQPAADLRMVLERDEATGRASVRLAWESVLGGDPESVRVRFDGAELPVTDPRRVALPPHDTRSLHFVQAEIDFAQGVSSVAEMTFGGTFAEEVATELTAVPVRLLGRGGLAGAEDLEGWLQADGAPLPITATEEGPAEVTFVVDRSALDRVARLGRRRGGLGRGLSGNIQQTSSALRYEARLADDHRSRILWPVPERSDGSHRAFDLFLPSREVQGDQGGVYWLLSTLRGPEDIDGEQRLADAVVVAGLGSATRKRRRAVVLILADGDDSSRLSAADARHYLRQIQVPFYVWSLTPLKRSDADRVEALRQAWGDIADASTLQRLSRRVRELRQELDSQRILWIPGRFLPQAVRLGPEAEGIEIAR